MNVRFERGYIARSELVVPLASIRLASRFGNPFGAGVGGSNGLWLKSFVYICT